MRAALEQRREDFVVGVKLERLHFFNHLVNFFEIDGECLAVPSDDVIVGVVVRLLHMDASLRLNILSSSHSRDTIVTIVKEAHCRL